MRYSFLLIFLLLSCTSQIKTSTLGCSGTGDWAPNPNAVKFKLEETYWFSPGKNKVRIVELLEKKDLNCKKIDSIQISFKKKTMDVIFSMIPFINRATVLVEGTLVSLPQEESDLNPRDG